MDSLSIITVNYNNYEGLVATLNSIRKQDYLNFDHWIIDGGSNDMMRSFEDLKLEYEFNHISESDNGIYHAMNKGIRLAGSSHLLFLNSGDVFAGPDSLAKLCESLGQKDLFYGSIWMGDEDSKTLVNYPNSLNLEYMICYGLPHQATIIKKSLFQQVGLYNENYKIISDWVFFMQALFDQSATYGMIDSPVILFDKSGISSQYAYTRKIIIEQLDYIAARYPAYVGYYKMNSPYVKKYFRGIPRWKRFWKKFLFQTFNKI
jgi:glycosyltransferase involved in cell wall biosynthesis